MKKSENGPQQARGNASKESKELMESPRDLRVKDKVIGSGKLKRINKSLWEVEKRAKDTQGKQMGQGCPRRNNGDKGAHK